MIPILVALARADDPSDANRAAAVDSAVVPTWDVTTYSAPNTNLEILCAKRQVTDGDQCMTIHLTGSGSAGALFRYGGDPSWFGQVRVSGEFRYGLVYGGYGLDGRLGTFWGLDEKYFRVYGGPDVFGNLYDGPDYDLRPGAGVAFELGAAIKPHEKFWINASAAPAWMFSANRRPDDLPPPYDGLVHELTYTVGAQYRGAQTIGAGFTWRRNAGGLQQGFYLGGSF